MSNGTSAHPLVSVIITNYNYGRFLPDCIGSVLAQSYPRLEVIVVDDGSADDSRAVLDSFGERIQCIFQRNSGQAAALSAGYARSSGEIVCLLDADDGWYPDKAATLVATFAAHPDVHWIRHKLALVTDELQPLHQEVPPFKGSGRIKADPMLLIEGLMPAGTSIALRRPLAERIFPLELAPEFRLDADDTILLARIFAARATGYSLDKVLGFYRRHDAERFGAHDLVRLLNREAAVSSALGRMFASGRTPSSAYKLKAVVGAIQGASWWDNRRLGNYLAGMRSAAALWSRPAICLRQVAALTFAFAAPSAWIRRLKSSQAFHGEKLE